MWIMAMWPILKAFKCSAYSKRNLKRSIYRIQGNNLIMCGYFCIGFIDFNVKDKNSDKIIPKYFQ